MTTANQMKSGSCGNWQDAPAWLPKDFASVMFSGGDEQTAMRNPKNYKFLPPKFTQQIDLAGRKTAASDHVNNVIVYAK